MHGVQHDNLVAVGRQFRLGQAGQVERGREGRGVVREDLPGQQADDDGVGAGGVVDAIVAGQEDLARVRRARVERASLNRDVVGHCSRSTC